MGEFFALGLVSRARMARTMLSHPDDRLIRDLPTRIPEAGQVPSGMRVGTPQSRRTVATLRAVYAPRLKPNSQMRSPGR
ncbi:hypothetical protein GCM10020258_27400 [Sphingomonas yabuuchiae]